MQKENDNIIETFDDDGNKVSFELVDIITVDDIEYALMFPQDKTHTEEGELLVMRLKKDGDDYLFETIEDDDEFNRVAQYIDEIEEEMDDE